MLVTDVLCPFCGCLCDDITIEVEDNQIKDVKRACRLGASKIRGHNRLQTPLIRENGEFRETTFDEAIEKTAQILASARRPLYYGWASTSCEVHKQGVLLTEITGGVLDSCTSVCHGPTALAVHEKGVPTVSLGQVKNRADLIIFWGSNPANAHPRHMSRYSVFPRGFFTKKGKRDRKIVVIDVRRTDTANIADEFIQVNPGEDYQVISAIRSIIAGHPEVVPEKIGGVEKEKLLKLAEMCKQAKFGSIFFGMGLTQSQGKYKNIDNAISLTSELNAHTKFSIHAMRGHYNVTGTGQVFAWETGYPNAIDMSRGAPYYNPGETAVNDVLVRDEIDAALIIAGDAGAHFPNQALKSLARVPLIQIDPYPNPTTELANIVIPTAICGIEAEGTAYRMDGISLRLRKYIDTNLPTDQEVLEKIINRVKELKNE